MEKKVDDGIDRISELPDSIIDYILDRFSDDIRFVIRTSVLSKRWKFCWTRVRNLYLDFHFIKRSARKKGFKLTFDTLLHSIMSRHDGLLDQLCLTGDSLPPSPYSMFSHPKDDELVDISRLMKVLSEKMIRKIVCNGVRLISKSYPFCFWNCATLTHLDIWYCDFGHSSDFDNFTNLVTLHLHKVDIPSSLLQTLISNSPHLKDLLLFDINIKHYNKVVINAPGLQSLSLSTYCNFCLKEYPNITSACLDLEFEVPVMGHKNASKLENFVRLVPKVELLSLSNRTLFDLNIWSDVDLLMKLPITLANLKYLKFYKLDIFHPDQLSSFFCLIRSSPNLQSLCIHVEYIDGYPSRELERPIRLFEAQERECILSCLSKITFQNLKGVENELRFISAVVNIYPMLKEVIISPKYYFPRYWQDWLLELVGSFVTLEIVTFHFPYE